MKILNNRIKIRLLINSIKWRPKKKNFLSSIKLHNLLLRVRIKKTQNLVAVLFLTKGIK